MKPPSIQSRTLFTALLAIAIAAIGCTATSSDGDDLDPESSEDAITASCKYPRRYIAVVGDGGCTEVVGARGRWVPSPLFEDAPEGANACVYSWSGERYARVDRQALIAHVSPYAYGNALTPSCGNAEQVREVAVLEPIPNLDVFSHAGSVGCDVCGIVKRDKIWVVLPPERVYVRQFAVGLTNGTMASFQIHADEGARAMTVTLPPPPAGTDYVEGHVAIY